MKKEYFSPEKEEFKYEIPTLFDTAEKSGSTGATVDEEPDETV